jgi:UDP-N-acetylglucosamine acyltransferase
MPPHIDPRAIVSPKSELGENVSIGPFAIVEDDVIIGDGTSIGSNALIANGARIGRGCRIFPFAIVSIESQDLKYKGEKTTFEIGDNTTVREFAALHRGTTSHWKSTVGSNCLIMAYAHVAHDCTVGSNVILANVVQLAGHVEIGDYAIIGGGTVVHQFEHIGQHAMIGGGFRIVKDVPPYILAGNEPLCFEGLNIVGLKRRGFSQEAIASLEQAYHLIYQSNLNVSQAVARIREEVPQTSEVQAVLDFIANSKRGIIRGPRHD